ncbi:MAG: TIM barrel protein [Eubacteriales bacterium]
MKQHFALELYSVRNDLTNDFEGTLKAVKAIGYEGVEFAGDYVHSAEKVAAVINEIGLQCCGWHTPWSYVQDDKLDDTILYNKTIGNRYVIVPGLPHKCTYTIRAWKATAQKFNILAEKLAAHDLILGYHNHSSEFRAKGGIVPYDVFFENTNKEIVMQLDNGNAMSGGADVCALIKRYPGRAQTVHVKPYSLSTGFDTMIGEDDIPLPEFMKLCDEVGGTKWYIVEYESEKLHAPLTGVKLCFDALMEMQAKGMI